MISSLTLIDPFRFMFDKLLKSFYQNSFTFITKFNLWVLGRGSVTDFDLDLIMIGQFYLFELHMEPRQFIFNCMQIDKTLLLSHAVLTCIKISWERKGKELNTFKDGAK